MGGEGVMAVKAQESGREQKDPVCGRRVDVLGASTSAEYKRRKYFFCSERCRNTFERQTERFRLAELAKAGALLTPGRVRWGTA